MLQRFWVWPMIAAGGLTLAGGVSATGGAPGGAAGAVETLPARAYAASALRVDDFVGTLRVEVGEAGPIELVLTGPADMLKDLGVRLHGDTLIIKRFGMVPQVVPFDAKMYPTIAVRVPDGTPLTIDDMDGRAVIGDINAPLMVFGASLDVVAGDASVATVERSGSGDISLGRVAGAVTARLAGSGDLDVGSAGSVDVEKRGSGAVTLGTVAGGIIARLSGSGDFIAASASTTRIEKRGSGDVTIGAIHGGLSFRSAGIGDVDVASVNGPVTIETESSGKIHIRGGRAEPLRVALAEYGDFLLDGIAVDPAIAVSGASVIKLQSFIGTFAPSGTGDIRVGGDRVYPLSDTNEARRGLPTFGAPAVGKGAKPADSQL